MFHNSGVNKVILVGTIDSRPEWKLIKKEKWLCFQLVTRELFTRQNVSQEHSEYHQIKIIENLGGNDTENLKEGAEVYLEGKINTISSVDSSGIRRYDTTITVSKFCIMQASLKTAMVER